MSKRIPFSTYRVQLGASCTFNDLLSYEEYFKELGVTDFYLSPILKPHSKSTHGYDVIDFRKINQKLGSLDVLEALSKRFFIILDIVPNHMSIEDMENLYFKEVVEKGEDASHSHLFDVDFKKHEGKIFFPFKVDAPFALSGSYEEAAKKLNYRRFFEIGHLIALRVEDERVFSMIHEVIFSLCKKGIVQGLRIDHIDGLLDPIEYLKKIKDAFPSLFVLVEKILSKDERLSKRFLADGTTGYEFIRAVDSLFVDPDGYQTLLEAFPEKKRAEEVVFNAKKEVLKASFLADIQRLNAIAGIDLTEEIIDAVARFPVYRFYLLEDGTPDEEGKKRLKEHVRSERLLSLIFTNKEFSARFSLLLAPAMAKGFEDTALYRLFPLSSLNEVGGELPFKPVDFHAFCIERLSSFPGSLNATETHDTKRGEDVRAQIHLLSEMAEEFLATFNPKTKEEWLLLQTILGTYEGSLDDEYKMRLQAYLVKAFREAKERSSWIRPDLAYESALCQSVEQLLSDEETVSKIEAFTKRMRRFGYYNSLSMLLCKVCAPGIADFYQGSELFRFNLVDPDNRRWVDFEKRKAFLSCLSDLEEMIEHIEDGRLKMFYMKNLLHLNQQYPELFHIGEYEPVSFEGDEKNQVFGFIRSLKKERILICFARFFTRGEDFSAVSCRHLTFPAYNHLLKKEERRLFEHLPHAIYLLS